MMKRGWIGRLMLMALAATAPAQEPIDAATNARIREEGFERSQVGAIFNQLTNVFGPRLTASPAYNESARWSRDRLEAWGLAGAHLEDWEFGRGWTLEGFTLEMTEPRYFPLIGYPQGWSPSTEGELIGAPVMLGGLTAEQRDELDGELEGAIVMTQPPVTNFIRTDRDPPAHDDPPSQAAAAEPPPTRAQRGARRGGARRGGRGQRGQRRGGRGGQRGQRGGRRGGRGGLTAFLQAQNVGVTLQPSRGEHGTLFVLGRDRGDDVPPSIVLQAEHYNMIAALIAAGERVELRVNVRTRFHAEDTNGYNVLAEIPGTDPQIGDEVVMVGAHLDSWHSAPGGTDNADGSAVVMEAMRILAALGVEPRRTIRMALWGGEEQGLHGSRQYVARHLAGEDNQAARDKFSVYFNLDPGAGPILGWFLEGNAPFYPIMQAWMAPFADLGPVTLTMRGIGSTDHLSFIGEGLPGFEAIHDYVDYDVRTHHTNMDTFERIEEDDLKQAAVVMASILYHAAMRDEKIPRAR